MNLVLGTLHISLVRDAGRLRIDHTRVSHKYLITGNSQPLSDECKSSLSWGDFGPFLKKMLYHIADL